MLLTFAICTRNRAFLLPQCLSSIFIQTKKYKHIEVLVVDNNSSDNTAALVENLQTDHPQLRYAFETKAGLSRARNHAASKARGEWIVFIDDDAKLRPGYVEQLLLHINEGKFDCFGGMYYAWFPFGTQRWLPKDFGNKKLLRPDVGLIDGSDGWLSGGNMAIRKIILKRVGGFDPQLGMTGNKVFYGEEDDLQNRLHAAGYKIGFDPALIIDHAVLPPKLKLRWHLNASFAQGATNIQLAEAPGSAVILWFRLLKSFLGLLLKRLPLALWKWLFRKGYYWQNLILDTLQPIYKAAGALSSTFA